MPDLFGEESSREAAKNFPARIEPTISESINSAWAVTDNSMTITGELYNSFEEIKKQAEKTFGATFWNPMDFLSTGNDRFSETSFFKEIRGRAEKLPVGSFPNYTSESVRQDIAAKRERARRERADISSREGFIGGALALGAEFAGVALDPVLLPSLFIGAGASMGIVRAALIDASIATAVEIPIQAGIQLGRQAIGEPVDISEAVSNVALVGGFTGALSFTIRGLISGGQKLIAQGKATQEVEDSVRELVNLKELLDANPYLDTAKGINQHLTRLEEAVAKAHGGATKARYESSTAVGSVERNAAPGRVRVAVEEITRQNNVSIRKHKPNIDADSRVQNLLGQIKKADGASKKLNARLIKLKEDSKAAKKARKEKDKINKELRLLRTRLKNIRKEVEQELSGDILAAQKLGVEIKRFDILDDAGETIGIADLQLHKKDSKGRIILEVEDIRAPEGANSLGIKTTRQIFDRLAEKFPKATHIKGIRTTGARERADSILAANNQKEVFPGLTIGGREVTFAQVRELSRAEKLDTAPFMVFDARKTEGFEGIFPTAKAAKEFISSHPDKNFLDFGTPRELERLNPSGPESPEFLLQEIRNLIESTSARNQNIPKAIAEVIIPMPRPRPKGLSAKVVDNLPDFGPMPKMWAEFSRFADQQAKLAAKKEFIPGPTGLREVRTAVDVNDILAKGKIPAKPLTAEAAAQANKVKSEEFDEVLAANREQELNPEVDITDEVTGVSKTSRLEEIAEDIKEEEAVTRELAACIASGGLS